MKRPLAITILIACTALTSALGQIELINDQRAAAAKSPPDWLTGDYATGDWVGYRARLEDRGVSLFGGFTAEVWGNTTGGIQPGAVYTGLLAFGVDLDLEKLAGWNGATFHSSWFWLSGRDASEDLVGNILTISNIAGFSTLRAFELWVEQSALNGRVSLRVGQLAADSEFLISDTGSLFINGTFGWPALTYANLPESGPGYPMAVPGIRLALHPTPWFSFLSAAFQGNPFAQNVNRHGFRWRLDADNGFTFINETQLRWSQNTLPGTIKAGAFFNTEFFERANASGEQVWGNAGFYGIIDQALYRESADDPDASASPQGVNAFARIGFTPQNRNVVGFYFDTGLAYTGPLPTRDADIIGLAIGFADLTPDATQVLFDEGAREVGYEMVIEATYQAAITPWLSIQPDAQYIIRPGNTGDLGNAFVLGARAAIIF